MNERYVEGLYNHFGGQNILGDFDNFKRALSTNSEYLQGFYNHFGGQDVLGDFDKFSGAVGFKAEPITQKGLQDTPDMATEPTQQAEVDKALDLQSVPTERLLELVPFNRDKRLPYTDRHDVFRELSRRSSLGDEQAMPHTLIRSLGNIRLSPPRVIKENELNQTRKIFKDHPEILKRLDEVESQLDQYDGRTPFPFEQELLDGRFTTSSTESPSIDPQSVTDPRIPTEFEVEDITPPFEVPQREPIDQTKAAQERFDRILKVNQVYQESEASRQKHYEEIKLNTPEHVEGFIDRTFPTGLGVQRSDEVRASMANILSLADRVGEFTETLQSIPFQEKSLQRLKEAEGTPSYERVLIEEAQSEIAALEFFGGSNPEHSAALAKLKLASRGNRLKRQLDENLPGFILERESRGLSAVDKSFVSSTVESRQASFLYTQARAELLKLAQDETYLTNKYHQSKVKRAITAESPSSSDIISTLDLNTVNWERVEGIRIDGNPLNSDQKVIVGQFLASPQGRAFNQDVVFDGPANRTISDTELLRDAVQWHMGLIREDYNILEARIKDPKISGEFNKLQELLEYLITSRDQVDLTSIESVEAYNAKLREHEDLRNQLINRLGIIDEEEIEAKIALLETINPEQSWWMGHVVRPVVGGFRSLAGMTVSFSANMMDPNSARYDRIIQKGTDITEAGQAYIMNPITGQPYYRTWEQLRNEDYKIARRGEDVVVLEEVDGEWVPVEDEAFTQEFTEKYKDQLDVRLNEPMSDEERASFERMGIGVGEQGDFEFTPQKHWTDTIRSEGIGSYLVGGVANSIPTLGSVLFINYAATKMGRPDLGVALSFSLFSTSYGGGITQTGHDIGAAPSEIREEALTKGAIASGLSIWFPSYLMRAYMGVYGRAYTADVFRKMLTTGVGVTGETIAEGLAELSVVSAERALGVDVSEEKAIERRNEAMRQAFIGIGSFVVGRNLMGHRDDVGTIQTLFGQENIDAILDMIEEMDVKDIPLVRAMEDQFIKVLEGQELNADGNAVLAWLRADIEKAEARTEIDKEILKNTKADLKKQEGVNKALNRTEKIFAEKAVEIGRRSKDENKARMEYLSERAMDGMLTFDESVELTAMFFHDNAAFQEIALNYRDKMLEKSPVYAAPLVGDYIEGLAGTPYEGQVYKIEGRDGDKYVVSGMGGIVLDSPMRLSELKDNFTDMPQPAKTKAQNAAKLKEIYDNEHYRVQVRDGEVIIEEFDGNEWVAIDSDSDAAHMLRQRFEYYSQKNPDANVVYYKKSAYTAREEAVDTLEVSLDESYSFEYESEADIPQELQGVTPLNRAEIEVGRGKNKQQKIRLTFSGQQLVDAGIATQKGDVTVDAVQEEATVQEETTVQEEVQEDKTFEQRVKETAKALEGIDVEDINSQLEIPIEFKTGEILEAEIQRTKENISRRDAKGQDTSELESVLNSLIEQKEGITSIEEQVATLYHKYKDNEGYPAFVEAVESVLSQKDQVVEDTADEVMSKYDGIFSKKTTGISAIDELVFGELEDVSYQNFYKRKRAEVVMMSPQEYLSRVREGQKSEVDELIVDSKKDAIRKAIDEGNKINMPMLSYDSEGNLVSQEGRNRASLAIDLGEVQIPVTIEYEMSFEQTKELAQTYVDEAISNGANTVDEVLSYIEEKKGLHRDARRFITDEIDIEGMLEGDTPQPTSDIVYTEKSDRSNSEMRVRREGDELIAEHRRGDGEWKPYTDQGGKKATELKAKAEETTAEKPKQETKETPKKDTKPPKKETTQSPQVALSSVEATAKALEGVDLTSVLTNLKTFAINKLKEFFHASPQKRQGRLKRSTAPQFGTGVYFSTRKDLVENEFGENVTNVVLNLSNPVFTNTKEWYDVARRAIELADKDYGKKNNLQLEEDETYFIYDPDNLSEIDEIPSKFISDAAQELGHDAIIDEGSFDYENEIAVLDDAKIIYKEDMPSFIAEAYHKAKDDDSNPELVAAVEELLGKQKKETKQPPKEEVKEPTSEEIKETSTKVGMTPKNLRDLYRVNRDIFGLNRIKSLVNAITMDRMIGAMANKRGVPKSEIYERISYVKSNPNNLKGLPNIVYQGKFQGQDADFIVLPEGLSIVDGWYSNIEKALFGIRQEKGTAAQFLSQIKKASGVKADELTYTGLEQWLVDKGNEKITKQDIVDFLSENRVEIVEVVKGKSRRDQVLKEIEDLGRKRTLALLENNKEEAKRIEELQRPLYEELNTLPYLPYQGDPKFSRYQLEGEKDNYREVLVTLPSRVSKPLSKWDFYQQKGYTQEQFESLPSEQKQELFEEYKKEADRMSAKNVKDFQSPHYDELNILVHLRMNTRTDSEGNKVLFLEEIQSDWAQVGRKRGFATPEISKRIQEINKRLVDIANDISAGRVKKGDVVVEQHELIKERDRLQKITPTAPFVTQADAWVKLALKIALREAVSQGATKVAWTTGEQQFDRWGTEKIDWVRKKSPKKTDFRIEKESFGWVVYDNYNNDAQEFSSKEKAENYVERELSKEGWTINIQEQFRGTAFEGMNVDYKAMSESGTTITTKEELKSAIDRNLSREKTKTERQKLTDRIWDRIQKEDSGTSLPRKEGMESFYDVLVPKVAGKLIKELTGKEGGVGETKLSVGDYKPVMVTKTAWGIENTKSSNAYDATYRNEDGVVYFNTEQSAQDFIDKNLTAAQQSIDITPRLKSAVESGMPLFQTSSEGAQGAMQAMADGTFVIHALTNPNVSTPLHELAHVFEHFLEDADRNHVIKSAKTKGWTQETSEYFAKGFEKYLAEGKAPTSTLQKIFDKFRDWLTDIYNGIVGSEIDVELNQGMRDIYAQMLGEDVVSNKETAPPKKPRNVLDEWADSLENFDFDSLPSGGLFILNGETLKAVSQAIIPILRQAAAANQKVQDILSDLKTAAREALKSTPQYQDSSPTVKGALNKEVDFFAEDTDAYMAMRKRDPKMSLKKATETLTKDLEGTSLEGLPQRVNEYNKKLSEEMQRVSLYASVRLYARDKSGLTAKEMMALNSFLQTYTPVQESELTSTISVYLAGIAEGLNYDDLIKKFPKASRLTTREQYRNMFTITKVFPKQFTRVLHNYTGDWQEYIASAAPSTAKVDVDIKSRELLDELYAKHGNNKVEAAKEFIEWVSDMLMANVPFQGLLTGTMFNHMIIDLNNQSQVAVFEQRQALVDMSSKLSAIRNYYSKEFGAFNASMTATAPHASSIYGYLRHLEDRLEKDRAKVDSKTKKTIGEVVDQSVRDLREALGMSDEEIQQAAEYWKQNYREPQEKKIPGAYYRGKKRVDAAKKKFKEAFTTFSSSGMTTEMIEATAEIIIGYLEMLGGRISMSIHKTKDDLLELGVKAKDADQIIRETVNQKGDSLMEVLTNDTETVKTLLAQATTEASKKKVIGKILSIAKPQGKTKEERLLNFLSSNELQARYMTKLVDSIANDSTLTEATKMDMINGLRKLTVVYRDSVVKEALTNVSGKSINQQIDEVIYDHYRKESKIGYMSETLAGKLVERLDIPADQAIEIEKHVFDYMLRTFREKKLAAAKKALTKVHKDRRPAQTKVEKMVNLVLNGALDDATLAAAFYEKFGIHALTSEEAAQLDRIARNIANADSASQRHREIHKWNAFLFHRRNQSWVKKAISFYRDAFYVGILSGVTTFQRNIVGPLAIMFEAVLTDLANPRTIKSTLGALWYLTGNTYGRGLGPAAGLSLIKDVLLKGKSDVIYAETPKTEGTYLDDFTNNFDRYWKETYNNFKKSPDYVKSGFKSDKLGESAAKNAIKALMGVWYYPSVMMVRLNMIMDNFINSVGIEYEFYQSAYRVAHKGIKDKKAYETAKQVYEAKRDGVKQEDIDLMIRKSQINPSVITTLIDIYGDFTTPPERFIMDPDSQEYKDAVAKGLINSTDYLDGGRVMTLLMGLEKIEDFKALIEDELDALGEGEFIKDTKINKLLGKSVNNYRRYRLKELVMEHRNNEMKANAIMAAKEFTLLNAPNGLSGYVYDLYLNLNSIKGETHAQHAMWGAISLIATSAAPIVRVPLNQINYIYQYSPIQLVENVVRGIVSEVNPESEFGIGYVFNKKGIIGVSEEDAYRGFRKLEPHQVERRWIRPLQAAILYMFLSNLFFEFGEDEILDDEGNLVAVKPYVKMKEGRNVTAGWRSGGQKDDITPLNSIVLGTGKWKTFSYVDNALGIYLFNDIAALANEINDAGGKLYSPNPRSEVYNVLAFSGITAYRMVPELSFMTAQRDIARMFGWGGGDPIATARNEGVTQDWTQDILDFMGRNVGAAITPATIRDIRNISTNLIGATGREFENRANRVLGDYWIIYESAFVDDGLTRPTVSRYGHPLSPFPNMPYFDLVSKDRLKESLRENPADRLWVDMLDNHSAHVVPSRRLPPLTSLDQRKEWSIAMEDLNNTFGFNLPKRLTKVERSALEYARRIRTGELVNLELTDGVREIPTRAIDTIITSADRRLTDDDFEAYYRDFVDINRYALLDGRSETFKDAVSVEDVLFRVNNIYAVAAERGIFSALNSESTSDINLPILEEIINSDPPNKEYFIRSMQERLSKLEGVAERRIIFDFMVNKVIDEYRPILQKKVDGVPLTKADQKKLSYVLPEDNIALNQMTQAIINNMIQDGTIEYQLDKFFMLTGAVMLGTGAGINEAMRRPRGMLD